MENTILKLAVFLLVQSIVYSAVHSRFVQIDQSPQRPTFHDAVTDLRDENKLEELHNNTSQTESLQDEATQDGSDLNSVLLRLKRHSNACVLRRMNKWSDCLGRRYNEIHCRSQSVACLSSTNVPPKCKKIYHLVRGENGNYCPVVTWCKCAA
ncbi:hypothetical protein ACROYT_G036829 [Oculina patagonica]